MVGLPLFCVWYGRHQQHPRRIVHCQTKSGECFGRAAIYYQKSDEISNARVDGKTNQPDPNRSSYGTELRGQRDPGFQGEGEGMRLGGTSLRQKEVTEAKKKMQKNLGGRASLRCLSGDLRLGRTRGLRVNPPKRKIPRRVRARIWFGTVWCDLVASRFHHLGSVLVAAWVDRITCVSLPQTTGKPLLTRTTAIIVMTAELAPVRTR
mmetsp:Transcript_1009/g.2163  ORF Transcript_1009/g.2163 Transcript_1009/m.2163 type:complete len:207 (+) Transcript_1009:1682-2302(+)